MAKILVLDDAAVMRRYLCECLRRGGHEAEAWLPLSAMEVPEKLQSWKPDLVFTDFQMPGCNGLSVARMAAKAAPELPVIVVTAFPDPEMEANLRKFGVRQILRKPVGCERLLQVVRETLEGTVVLGKDAPPPAPQ